MTGRLIYYPDDKPGITRRRCGRGFSYYAADGTLIRDPSERTRIQSYAVPPAYCEVWITPKPNGHLLATGRDARGRKQYRYHEKWTAQRDERKYAELADFGRALPRLRSAIASGLREPTGSRQLARAAVLALLDRAALRIGNACYAEDNGSYGATTLLGDHVCFDDTGVHLAFPAKHGAEVIIHLHGARLQKALNRMHDMPGAELFTWQDDDGTPRTLGAEEINASLRDLCGEGASAKTFRTWNGTHAAFATLARTDEEVTLAEAIEAAAERLHNTPAIARSSYIHPAVIDLAKDDAKSRKSRLKRLKPPKLTGLRAHEDTLIAFLEKERTA